MRRVLKCKVEVVNGSQTPYKTEMAKYACPYCDGFAHTSGAIPNPNECLLISDVAFQAMPDIIDSDVLYKQFKHLFKCVSCDAIAIFWRGLSVEPTWYSPGLQASRTV